MNPLVAAPRPVSTEPIVYAAPLPPPARREILIERAAAPEPRLRLVCAPIASVTHGIRSLALEMKQIMAYAGGIGLAAPQVGEPIRMFVALLDPHGSDGPVAFINPEIIEHHGKQKVREGCLSLPGQSSSVKRARTVRVRALDLDGRLFEMTLAHLPAVIVQHECDHLDGVLMTARAKKPRR